MPVNPADSPILGTLYGSDAMRAVFDERAYFQRMLDVEAALARVQARLGIIPADAAAGDHRGGARREPCAPRNSPPARAMSAIRWSAWSPTCRAAAGEAGGWTHWGATTQDIMDTATVLQVREGLALIRAELRGMVQRLDRAGGSASRHGDGRAHPSATGVADHIRPQMRHLGVAVDRPPPAPRRDCGGASNWSSSAARPARWRRSAIRASR